jgi:hypothetical protein
MLAISARERTMKIKAVKVKIYPQKRPANPPLMSPPIGALITD